MLHVVDIVRGDQGVVVLDPYVPLEFRTSDDPIRGAFEWTTGDFKRNLLEVSIHPDTHVVSAVTLVNYNNPVEETSNKWFNRLDIAEGLPVIDVTTFPHSHSPERGIDERRRLRISITEDRVIIMFDKSTTLCREIQSNRIRFLLNTEDQMCGVEFVELTHNELELVRTVLKRKSAQHRL